MLCIASCLYCTVHLQQLKLSNTQILNYAGPTTSYEIQPSSNKLFQGILLFISTYKLKTCATRRRVARG